jgi:hypothetical protein
MNKLSCLAVVLARATAEQQQPLVEAVIGVQVSEQNRNAAKLRCEGQKLELEEIARGDLVQPIDDFFVGHCGCVAASPFRFLAEKRGIGGDRGVRQRFIHVDLTLGLHGTIQPFARAYR